MVNNPESIPDNVLQFITVVHNIIFTRAWEIKLWLLLPRFGGCVTISEKIAHLEDVVTPLYDVISAEAGVDLLEIIRIP